MDFRYLLIHSVVLLSFSPSTSSLLESLSSDSPNGIYGHELCPCIDSVEDTMDPSEISNLTLLGVKNMTTYGIGCRPHDADTIPCTDHDDECFVDPNFLPSSNSRPACDKSYCRRSWCYIDPNHCDKLVRTVSRDLPHSKTWYSYATCGELDSFTNITRLNALRGTTLNVGFNHNSGGWTGTYSSKGVHFEGPGMVWHGPAVDFVREAARIGGFNVNVSAPPEELKNKSNEYFSSSSFDHCVYSTALGFNDFCVAKYTVTDERAVSADWFVLDNDPMYLIVQSSEQGSNFEVFSQNFLTIFKPFSGDTWMVIMFGFLPFLALTLMFQERGIPGSDFPSKHQAPNNGSTLPSAATTQTYPQWKNFNRAFYRGIHSYLRRGYGLPVKTYGGAWTVLAFCFIGMIGMSLYTAQMAAHLTAKALEPEIASLEEAIKAGYRFCGERKSVNNVMKLYGIEDRFVADPVELGGDGEPGFNCRDCSALTRVIDFIDPKKADAGDPLYCHAAVAGVDDLEVFQGNGLHCNKTIVGQPLSYVATGFPLSNQYSASLRALFLTLKNSGTFEGYKREQKPLSSCQDASAQSGANSLTPYDLVGIWIVTTAFALIGILVSVFERKKSISKQLRRGSEHMRSLRSFESHRLESFRSHPRH